MTLEPTRRSRFRWAFSLRALFVVVTLIACCFGYVVWQMQIVQERKEIRTILALLHGSEFYYLCLETEESQGIKFPADVPPLRISRIRRLLGDETCISVGIPRCDPALIERTETAFPEATISLFDLGDRNVYAIRHSLYGIGLMNRGNVFKTGTLDPLAK